MRIRRDEQRIEKLCCHRDGVEGSFLEIHILASNGSVIPFLQLVQNNQNLTLS